MYRMMWIGTVIFAIAGCDGGEDPSTDTTASCDRLESGLCEEYTVPVGRLTDLEASCTGSDGSWQVGTCSGGSAGGCLETRGDGEMILYYYSTDAATVMQTCADNGQTYVAP